jgi:excinuclease UvrABC ATPase subunit
VKIKHADGTLETLSSRSSSARRTAPRSRKWSRASSHSIARTAPVPNCNGLGTKSLFSEEVCPVCEGKRLRPEALRVYLKGKKKKKGLGINIVDFTSLSIAKRRSSWTISSFPRCARKSRAPSSAR